MTPVGNPLKSAAEQPLATPPGEGMTIPPAGATATVTSPLPEYSIVKKSSSGR